MTRTEARTVQGVPAPGGARGQGNPCVFPPEAPQGSFGSHPIGDFLRQFVTWEFMDF